MEGEPIFRRLTQFFDVLLRRYVNIVVFRSRQGEGNVGNLPNDQSLWFVLLYIFGTTMFTHIMLVKYLRSREEVIIATHPFWKHHRT